MPNVNWLLIRQISTLAGMVRQWIQRLLILTATLTTGQRETYAEVRLTIEVDNRCGQASSCLT
ncbi:MAG: hypothetical protein M1358_26025, partial [Chloroflexi bacterium]|nr:hypothetical protein [Chloroflexota bacterium]